MCPCVLTLECVCVRVTVESMWVMAVCDTVGQGPTSPMGADVSRSASRHGGQACHPAKGNLLLQVWLWTFGSAVDSRLGCEWASPQSRGILWASGPVLCSLGRLGTALLLPDGLSGPEVSAPLPLHFVFPASPPSTLSLSGHCHRPTFWALGDLPGVPSS